MNRDSRKYLYDVHSWAGFIVGIALLIVCLSGAIAVFSPEIDRLSNPALQAKGGTVNVDADEAWSRLVRAAPTGADFSESLSLELPYGEHSGIYGMNFAVGKGYEYAYLDAHDGSVRPPRSNHVFYFLRHLHVRLLYNRLPVGIVGLAMLVSIATGLLIYKHIMRDMFRMRWRRTGNIRVTFADFHKLVGFWALLFHIAIATTGTWLALEGYLNPVIAKMADRQTVSLAEGGEEPEGEPVPRSSVKPIAPMIEQARDLIPGFNPTYATVDDRGSVPTLRISGNVPGLVQEGVSHVLFDRHTGKVQEVFDVREKPLLTQFRYALEPVHYGYYGGFWVKFLYLLIGLMPAILSLTGALLWFERRKQDQDKAARSQKQQKA